MGSGIRSSSWQWQILCALKWQNLLCVSSPCMGNPCPECSRKPCFLLCLPFFFLPFSSPSLSTFGLFFCYFSFVFSWRSSNPGHPCSLDLLCLLNPPQLFLPTLRKHSTFICQLEEQETSPPAHSVSYMSALSVFFRIVSEMETRLTRGPRPGLDNQLPDGFSKAQERTVVSLLNLLILCFPFHCSLLFYFLLPFPLGFAVFFFNFLF